MIKAKLAEYNILIENRINQLLPEGNLPYKKVVDASRYSLLLGGKRIRPALVIEFCLISGGSTESAIDLAVALEMIHTYSLIHDDLPCMDNDDMRRGKPSCHIAFGEDIALLAGDTLLTKAFSVIVDCDLSAEQRIKAVGLLADYAGVNGMIGGQVLDLSFESSSPDAEQLTEMYSLKTAALLICAASLGFVSADKYTEENLKFAKEYGYNLGLAFQIIDDILDCTADEALLGKPVGSDEKNEKTTFVSLYGIEKARIIAKDMTEKALQVLDRIDGDTEVLKNLTEYLLKRNY